jgi:hypothetical protein
MKEAMLEPNLSISSMTINVDSDRLALFKLRLPVLGSSVVVLVKNL